MKGNPQKTTMTGIKYYAVIYLFNDTFHGVPFDSAEDAQKYGRAFTEKMIKEHAKTHDPKTNPWVKNFYVIKRNLAKYENGEVI